MQKIRELEEILQRQDQQLKAQQQLHQLQQQQQQHYLNYNLQNRNTAALFPQFNGLFNGLNQQYNQPYYDQLQSSRALQHQLTSPNSCAMLST